MVAYMAPCPTEVPVCLNFGRCQGLQNQYSEDCRSILAVVCVIAWFGIVWPRSGPGSRFRQDWQGAPGPNLELVGGYSCSLFQLFSAILGLFLLYYTSIIAYNFSLNL